MKLYNIRWDMADGSHGLFSHVAVVAMSEKAAREECIRLRAEHPDRDWTVQFSRADATCPTCLRREVLSDREALKGYQCRDCTAVAEFGVY